MTYDFQLRLLPEQAYTKSAITDYIAAEKGINRGNITHVRVLRRSIDARQRTIYVNLTVRVYENERPEDQLFEEIAYRNVDGCPQVVVVGAGPAGLFAALRLIELGVRPVVVERGKDVHSRRKDVGAISKTQEIDSESNYCFGEGGAGAFSDGKLFTRSKKRGNVEKILRVFCQHGANPSILIDAHPHIGTNKLPGIIESMRHTIQNCGGEVHFQTKMTGLLIHGNKVEGITTADGREFRGQVILATGHSARDVYQLLHSRQIEIAPKGIAVGVRLEHPAILIDRIQYHNKEGKGKYLPPAEYSYVMQAGGRGVYSFCMCPGGTVVPAASGPEQVVVNGMSAAERNSPWSNSGMVVETRPEDLQDTSLIDADAKIFINTMLAAEGQEWLADSPLAMMQFQAYLEKLTWQQSNRHQTAPAQRMADFVNKRVSGSLPTSSYQPGLIISPLHFWLPKFISTRLQEGFRHFGKHAHGFLTNEATMIAIETRTSSPVRILRDPASLQHIRIEGLFPCGEGAGYAGGIVSAGIDGERCAEMASQTILT
jgi:uncharacterized FAD-dependent dehydrogenase